MPQAAVLPALSAEETKDLQTLCEIVDANIDGAFKAGNALREINERKLYRESHKTFQAFCESRFNMTRRRGYQLIEAATVIENVNHGTQNGDTQRPSTERQTRELAKAPEEKQAEAWEAAVESANGEQPTARQVAAAVEKVSRPEPKPPTDMLDLELPDYLVEPFKVFELFQKAQAAVRELRDLVHEIAEHPGGAVLRRELQPTGEGSKLRYRWPSLESINHALKSNKPYTRCPYCEKRVKAKPPKDCRHCNGSGWCTKQTYDGYANYEKAMA